MPSNECHFYALTPSLNLRVWLNLNGCMLFKVFVAVPCGCSLVVYSCLSGAVVVLGILGLVFGSIFYNTIRVHGLLIVDEVTNPGSANGMVGFWYAVPSTLVVPFNILTPVFLCFASLEPMRNSDQPEEERPNPPVPVSVPMPVPVRRTRTWPVIMMPLASPKANGGLRTPTSTSSSSISLPLAASTSTSRSSPSPPATTGTLRRHSPGSSTAKRVGSSASHLPSRAPSTHPVNLSRVYKHVRTPDTSSSNSFRKPTTLATPSPDATTSSAHWHQRHPAPTQTNPTQRTAPAAATTQQSPATTPLAMLERPGSRASFPTPSSAKTSNSSASPLQRYYYSY